jgi:hypothetical protein
MAVRVKAPEILAEYISASVISSVIALSKRENPSDQTKAGERIRNR